MELSDIESQASDQSTEVTPQSTPAAEPTAAPEGSHETTSGEATQEQQSAYEPNYKFRFPKFDNRDQEKEFDDWAKGLVNKDNENHFRDLYTKAYGLDFLKQKYSRVNQEFNTYKEQYEPLVKTWNELNEVYKQGDLDSFFGALKIPQEKIYEYVLQKLNERDMPHEQRLEREQQREVTRKAHLLEKQNQDLQARYQDQLVQQRSFTLDQALSRPEVSNAVKAFDEKMGQEGSFRDEVIKRGLAAYHATGQDISPEDAVAEVMKLMGAMGFSGGSENPQLVPPSQARPQQVARKAPVIPNVGARGASPTKRAPRSLADLKKLAASMQE